MAAVHLHRIRGNPTQREKILNEKVLPKNHVFAGGCALRLKKCPRSIGPLVLGKKWADDRFHINERLDLVRMTLRP